MFISPKIAIEKGWIKKNDCNTYEDWVERKYVSPNAIDFTLDQLFTIDSQDEFVISEDIKKMRSTNPLPSSLSSVDGKDWWEIKGNTSVDGMSHMTMDLPEGVAAMLVIRSTFNRNGMYLTSGLYDSGYQGPIGFVLHNNVGTSLVAAGTRVGQIMFVESNSEGKYAGGYNHAAGTHWSE